MAELVLTGFSDAAERLYSERIRKLIGDGRECLMIVPEQYTLSVEKQMARALPAEAPLYFEVINFTRLADKVFRLKGGLAKEHADRARRALLLWECLTELSPTLRATRAPEGEISAGLVTRTLAAIKEMEGFGIDANALECAGADIRRKNGRLADKLCDLSSVMSMYGSLLAERYNELGSELELAAEKLETDPTCLTGTHIFIMGFTSFTESQYRLISILMGRCELSVALNMPRHGQGSFEYTELRSVRSRLMREAGKLSVRLTEICPDDEDDGGLLSQLWRVGTPAEAIPAERLPRIFEAETPYEECRFIAEEINRIIYTSHGDVRYSDIAIIARSTDAYIGTLDDALKKSNIPHFISRTKDIFSFEAVKLLISALEAVASGYSRENIISFMKCGFSGISREACDKFELYTDIWQINGERLIDSTEWHMSPGGYTARKGEAEEDMLASVNMTKRALGEIFIPFGTALAAAETVEDYARVLTELALRLELEERIAERSELLRSLGEDEASDDEGMLWQLICSSLDTLVEAAGEAKAGIESFKSRFELVLAEAKVGRLPSYRDAVTVGAADSLRISKKKHIFIIGANRGEFPKIPGDNAYFGDSDKRELASYGLNIEGGSEFDFARELYYFSRAIASAEGLPDIFYTRSDFSFKPASPSDAVSRIIKLSGGELKPIPVSKIELRNRIYSLEAALEAVTRYDLPELEGALEGLGYGASLPHGGIRNEGLSLSPEAAALMYPGDLYLTQTRIDKFIDCPLAYFCEYKLKLGDSRRAEFDARNIGSFVHSILESFFREASGSERSVYELTREEKLDIAERSAKSYLESLGSDVKGNRRVQFALSRLKHTALPVIEELCDELSACDFKPRFFELNIEKDTEGAPRASKFTLSDGTAVRVMGAIDRVDTYEKDGNVYVRVIDYKTGQKKFDPSDLDDGRNLQMFLYLKSIVDTDDRAFLDIMGVEDGGRIIPAGVIYIKANLADVKIAHSDEECAIEGVKKNQKREGMILNDSESLTAMNPDYIPVSFKKDGTPYSRSEKFLYTHAGWETVSEKLERAVIRVAEGMKSGNVSAAPMKNKKTSPCEYCSYKAVCRNAEV